MIKGKEKFEIVELKDLSPFDEALDKLEPKLKEGVKYTLYLLDDKKQRTLNANKYYFGVVLKTLSNFFGEKDDSITVANIHEVLKGKFNSKVVFVDGSPFEIGESTTSMTQDRFVQYIESIREWALDSFNVWIPTPTEVIDADFGDLYIEAYHIKK